MSQPFEIDTDALGRAEAPFRELAQRLVTLSNQVQAQVSSLGAVWGDDKSGQGFVEKYGPARDGLLEAFSSTGDVVTSTADGVRTMAQGYQRTEESNSDASSQLLRHALTARTEGLLPETATSGAVEGVPAGTLRRARLEAARPAEPMRALRRDAAEPLQPTRALRRDAVEPLQPTRALRRDAVEPLQPTQALRRDAVEPLQPTARVEALPGIPAEPMRARDQAMEPLQPTHRVQADRAESLRAEPVTPALPTVAAEPVQAARRMQADPVMPAAARMDAVPATPAVPMEPLQAARRVEADHAVPATLTHATRRVVDAPLLDETRTSEA